MKRSVLFMFVLISVQLNASWSPFGPEGIQANRICFALDQQSHWGICHDGGLYLYDFGSQTWTNHPALVPVLDACYLDGSDILVIMGEGTDSDGIYRFNSGSGQFELIDFVDCPRFISYCEGQQTYYIGHQHGLLKSADGLTWSPVDTFINKAIVTMDTYGDHLVVSEMDNLYGIWYSPDAGATWTLSPGSPMVNCLGFNQEGTLYGTFPDGSYSSGLWSSTDFGQTWEVEFWSLETNCVGFDYANVFVGWGANATGAEQGIAWYHPETGLLTFINSNLPNLTINQITHNPAMSAIALFCCTENGVYISYDYFLGVPEQGDASTSALMISPNPANGQTVLSFSPVFRSPNGRLTVFTLSGEKVWQTEADLSTGRLLLDCSGFPPGVYVVEIEDKDNRFNNKLIIR